MTGSIFALLSAIAFALNNIFIRRAVINITDPSLGTLISVPMSVPIVFFILILTGKMQVILSFSFQGYIWLSLAGVFLYVVGRSLFYKCVQLIGANITNILRRVSILVSVLMGITLLHEPISWHLVIGVLLIVAGVTLVGMNPSNFHNSGEKLSGIPSKALFLGIGCGVFVGVAHIFAKLGIKDTGSPVAGLFISFLAATIILSVTLMNREKRTLIAHMRMKTFTLFFIAGLLSCIASLTLYTALNLSPASVVVPLISISPVFQLVFSFLFNRKLEIFSIPIIIGTIAVVIGGGLLV